MNKPELLQTLNQIFSEVFPGNTVPITEATTATDIEDWDSLNNIQLVVTIEKRLKIKFRADEISNWKNVGEMADSILKRVGG